MHPEGYHRRSIRLPGYDYRGPGAYFVTVCAYNRQCLFGRIADGEMRLSECGQAISEEWSRTAAVRHNVALDAFVVMPNHIHGIIIITHPAVGASRRFAPTLVTPATPYEPSPRFAPTTATPAPPRAGSIGAIMAQFKSITTKRINGMRGAPGAPIWQRNYYEHIIRDEESLHRIREYITTNPLRWAQDSENPAATQHDEFDTWLDAQGQPHVHDISRGEPAARPYETRPRLAPTRRDRASGHSTSLAAERPTVQSPVVRYASRGH